VELVLLFGLPFLAWGMIGGSDSGSDTSAEDVPADSDPGPVSTDIITDPSGSAETLTVDSTVYTATAGSDHVEGTDTGEVIFSGSGRDDVSGGDGDDVISGEAGADTLGGGAGDDTILGGLNDDKLYGGTGDDFIMGGAGNDYLDGGSGSDLLLSSSGGDTLVGGAGDDYLLGVNYVHLPADTGWQTTGFGRNILDQFGADLSPTQVDRLGRAINSSDAATDPSELYGGDGNDFLFGDKGDILTGGAGKDDFSTYHVSGDDTVKITDYTPSDDALTIFHDGSSVLPTSVADVSGGAMLHLDGEPVALLAGVKAADVDLSKVTQIY
jgi:Ca2+-binding RTX toxin-like protein